ncbi:MAG: hypothetical protein HUU35_07850, partial [Armatimonadetes bacterium]|nr:hypothetical protein [Armatimonadota bacterium]
MRRQRLGLAILLVLTVHGAPAQQLETLPYYEEQMAGVRLGWHARTITGLWNYDQVRSDIQARLRSLYRMPDHIIMRVGTRIPIFTGSGAGPDGSYNFYLGTYGRGNSEGGGGLGGG